MWCNHSKPLLSLIIPVYNTQEYLDRCLKSVQNQTYRNIEIILVDDGSTDRSGQMCDNYAAKDRRVKVIHRKNAGLVSARKEGLKVATGTYAAYVDADDWIEKNMYTELLQYMKESDADLVTSGCIRDYGTYYMPVNESVNPGIYENETLTEKLLTKMVSTDCFFQSRIFVSACTKIFKKDFLVTWQNKVDNDINIGEDAMLMYYCLLNAKRVAVSGMNYYHYCIRGDSITGIRKPDEWQRFQVLFGLLEKECGRHRKRVVNIMEQIKLHEYYLVLLQYAEQIVYYKNYMLFPFGEVRQEEKVVVYGAGKFGKKLKSVLEEIYEIQIVAWIDKAGKPETQAVEILNDVPYDKIIIAVLVADLVDEIKRELIQRGIKPENILSVDLELLKDRMKKDAEIPQKI